jgi:hypothetical protein
MKVCANPKCKLPFVTVNERRKYCCVKCRKAVDNARPSSVASRQKWAENNPDKLHELRLKTTAKNYREGKLPPWMYS